MPEGVISIDDPRADDIRELLERHLAFARSTTAPEDVYALDVNGLVDPAVTFFSYRVEGKPLGVAALKRIDDEHAEIKSMHTAEEARGQGVGRALVDHLVGMARERGYRRVSLETGSGPAFAPARSLYAAANFTPCGAFGDYRPSPNSEYMTLSLDGPAEERFPIVAALIDAWNRRDLQAALELMHPRCEARPVETTETLYGHDGVATAFRGWFEAFEEFTIEVEDYSAHGDRVLVAMRQRARGKGSGVEVEERFYQLFTVRDGKVFRFEEYSDEPDARNEANADLHGAEADERRDRQGQTLEEKLRAVEDRLGGEDI